MKDRIPLFNAKNNKIKFDLTGINSWEQFVAANNAGTLRADVYSNNDGSGTLEIGDTYSVANVLPLPMSTQLGIDHETSQPADALKVLADSSLTYQQDYTLQVINWQGLDAPFTYIISDPRIKANNKIHWLPGLNITENELDVLQGANIQDGGQINGQVTLIAFKSRPSIDLPIRILFGGVIHA